MKSWILVDDNNIVRCISTKECNLHKDKLYMNKYYVDLKGCIGDGYDETNDSWTDNQDEVIVYNASTFLAWCMSTPLQSDEFQALDDGIKLQAITYTMRFGDNANNDGAILYRQAALLLDSITSNTVCSEMSETVIAKAIEMGAPITTGE